MLHDPKNLRSYYFEKFFVFRTCGNFEPQVLYSYTMKNPKKLLPNNVIGQRYDNRIDCSHFTTKNTWEIIVTGTIPLDPISGQIV
jgi:hypothetical protein